MRYPMLHSLSAWVSAVAALLACGQARVDNLARSFKVLEAAEKPYGFHLVLRNDYGSAIGAYALMRGSGRVVWDLDAEKQPAIAPGQTVVVDLRFQVQTSRRGSNPPPLGIAAVVFVDGSGDGDFLSIEMIRSQRTGRAVQMRQVVALLEKTRNLPDAEIEAGLQRLAQQISDLPTVLYGGSVEAAASDPEYLTAGLRRAKMDALADVRRIAGGGTPSAERIRDALLQLAENYQRRVNQLAPPK